VRNNNPNYKIFIRKIDETFKDDEKKRLAHRTFIEEIIDLGCVGALKFAIEEIKWEFEDNYLVDRTINNQDVLSYLYRIVKEEDVKFNLLLICSYLFKKYVCETNNVEKIKKYYETHINMIRETVRIASEDKVLPEVPALYFMGASCLSKQSRIHLCGLDPNIYRWINVDVIIYLLETFPPTIDHIREEKDDIIRYLGYTESIELLNRIEKIIGCNLLFLKGSDK